jgi:hypothetical protein
VLNDFSDDSGDFELTEGTFITVGWRKKPCNVFLRWLKKIVNRDVEQMMHWCTVGNGASGTNGIKKGRNLMKSEQNKINCIDCISRPVCILHDELRDLIGRYYTILNTKYEMNGIYTEIDPRSLINDVKSRSRVADLIGELICNRGISEKQLNKDIADVIGGIKDE